MAEEVLIQSIGTGGVGVGSLSDGRIVFVPRTVPGDRAMVALTRQKPRFAKARLVELLEEGPHRMTPPCPRYEECDGCSLQHLSYQEQVRWKGTIVGDALRRIGGLALSDPPVRPSPSPFRYRNRVTFTLRRLRGGGVVAGFRQFGHSSRVLDVDDECLLPDEAITDCWRSLRAQWGPGAKYLPGGRELRLTLRGDVDGVSLVIQGGRGRGEPEFLMERVPSLVSIWKRRATGPAVGLAGKKSLTISEGPDAMEIGGGVFTQVNEAAGEGLRDAVLDGIGNPAGLRIVDAYCGPSAWGREAASFGAQVTGIDILPGGETEGSADGRGSFRLVSGTVEGNLESCLPADLLILNPPRSGLHPSIPDVLIGRGPNKILYVSCDPATLARDLRRIDPAYSLTDVQSFDLFPQTGHVETVVNLLRKSGATSGNQHPEQGQQGTAK